jgi:uncharacterized protein (TIGR02145 family)
MTWANGYSGTVNIQVTANGCNGPSPMIIRTVIVNTGPTPTLTGPGSPCAGSTGNVYITQSGMTGYNWIISAGGVITAGGGITDTSVTVTWNTSGPQSVSVSYTGANGCIATAPAIFNVTVNPDLPVSVSITASANPFCLGIPVTFTATPINGGASPAYQWKVNGFNTGTNSSTLTYTPADNDSVRCILTSGLVCVTNNPASSQELLMTGIPSPIVTFVTCFDSITTIDAKPFKLKGGIPLGGTYTGPGVDSVTGIFNPATAGIGVKTITYKYTNAGMCAASAHANVIISPIQVVNCGSSISDIRDNQIYPTVQIGSQCWLASNLNYGIILVSSQDQRDNCVPEKYCYNDNPVSCASQGGFYQWDELMRYDNTPGSQGFCPPGWHVPVESEWDTLFANYINNGYAGTHLKYTGTSGFNALMSGANYFNRGWKFQGFATFFWSSSPHSSTQAWAHGMNNPDPSVSLYPSSRVNAFSVRCLKD